MVELTSRTHFLGVDALDGRDLIRADHKGRERIEYLRVGQRQKERSDDEPDQRCDESLRESRQVTGGRTGAPSVARDTAQGHEHRGEQPDK